jgi:AcrR family transcriptional regulator
MSSRARILRAAAELIAQSSEADLSTRAVCEAAGVAAPALYRQFGDKEGLLSAVVDFGFEQFLASKRAVPVSDDPAEQIRAGWNSHIQFAVENPNIYRLMWSPGLGSPPAAAGEAHQILFEAMERAAAAGCLRMSAESAAQVVMAACSGSALSIISRPEQFDEGFAAHLREAVIAAVVAPAEAASRTQRSREPAGTSELATAAATLLGRLATEPVDTLTEAEQAVLAQWLKNLADTPRDEPHPGRAHATARRARARKESP